MNCPHCNNPVLSFAKQCPACKKKLFPKKSSISTMIFILAVLFVIAIIYFGSSDRDILQKDPSQVKSTEKSQL